MLRCFFCVPVVFVVKCNVRCFRPNCSKNVIFLKIHVLSFWSTFCAIFINGRYFPIFSFSKLLQLPNATILRFIFPRNPQGLSYVVSFVQAHYSSQFKWCQNWFRFKNDSFNSEIFQFAINFISIHRTARIILWRHQKKQKIRFKTVIKGFSPQSLNSVPIHSQNVQCSSNAPKLFSIQFIFCCNSLSSLD